MFVIKERIYAHPVYKINPWVVDLRGSYSLHTNKNGGQKKDVSLTTF